MLVQLLAIESQARLCFQPIKDTRDLYLHVFPRLARVSRFMLLIRDLFIARNNFFLRLAMQH